MKQAVATLLAEQVKAGPLGANQDMHEFAQQALVHLDSVHNLAVWISGSTVKTQDLIQEAYLQAFRSFRQLQPGTNCQVWLLSILRHVYISRCQQKRQGPEVVDWEKIDQAYESIVEQGERADRLFSRLTDGEIKEALKGLPEEYRTALILVDIAKLSYQEVAEVMECSIRTIYSRVSRGRRMWQVELTNYALERDLNKASPTLNSWVTFRTRIAQATLSFLAGLLTFTLHRKAGFSVNS